MGLTISPRKKKLPVRKPEMWPWKGLLKRMQPMQGTGRSSQGTDGYGGGPLWRQRPALGYSANEEEDINKCLI